jgi:prepilin peptidase CpaA
MRTLSPEVIWPVTALVVIATVFDLLQRRIPNLLTVPALLAGLLHALLSGGLRTLNQSLLGILTAAGALGIFCYLRAMGMGDLKLAAAVAAWIGVSQTIVALLLTALAGGIIAGAAVVAQGCVRHMARKTGPAENSAVKSIPYAPAIAVGTILSFFGTP